MFVTKASHTVIVDFGCGQYKQPGEGWAPSGRHTMKMKTKNTLIPDPSQPGITMTAPTVRHRDVADKYATGYQRPRKLEVGRKSLLEHGM